MKRLLLAITLVCVLSGTALAGDIPGVDSTAPAPSSGQPSSGTALAGDIPGVDSAAPSSDTQPSAVVDVLLTIINLVV